MTSRTPQRLAMGVAATFSVREACELLPWGDNASRRWLEAKGLIVRRPDLPGPVVVWRRVLEELERELLQERVEQSVPAARPILRRAGL